MTSVSSVSVNICNLNWNVFFYWLCIRILKVSNTWKSNFLTVYKTYGKYLNERLGLQRGRNMKNGRKQKSILCICDWLLGDKKPTWGLYWTILFYLGINAPQLYSLYHLSSDFSGFPNSILPPLYSALLSALIVYLLSSTRNLSPTVPLK
jgi:hypothetical protein